MKSGTGPAMEAGNSMYKLVQISWSSLNLRKNQLRRSSFWIATPKTARADSIVNKTTACTADSRASKFID